MEHGDYRYNETIVFDYNRETREVGKIIHMDQDTTKSIKKHLAICQDFYLNGCAAKESD
jgi:hypothetical protein